MASDHSIEAVTTLPSQRPRMHAPMKDHYPLPARLENAITSYSVHLIMALITLPTLIWHISSTHIHDDYGMPDDWVEKFDTTQFTSKRGLLWGFLFAVVPIDCLHALLALDYYHGRRYERGHEPGEAFEPQPSSLSPTPSSTPSTKTRTTTTTIPLPTHPAHTYHPLFTRRLSSLLHTLLLTLFDLALTAFLTVHISVFFNLLDKNWDACSSYTSPYPDNFLDPMGTGMTVLQRCHRINTDMYVSGGFDVALCVLLLGVHLWHLAWRAWEVSMFGMRKDDWVGGEKARSIDGREGGKEMAGVVGRLDGCGEGRSTAVPFRDWRAEERRKRGRSEDSEKRRERSSSEHDPNWGEVLLGCLVP